ncbi:MAG TPA: BACON domain-containing protein, partial [Bryobacteraceae bacterium]|nr:BACON domain-containing protein [Bryobacteraceae bacterium]
IKPGPRSLYALGRIANSQGINALSDPIVLEVERLDRPVRVVVEPGALYLEIHPGSDPKSSEEHLRVYYQYADGARVPVPPKTYGLNTVVFRPQVGNVTVNPLGVVSPFRAGTDQVWVDCVACAGGTDPGPVSVTVTAPALYVAQKSISAGAQGGSFNLDVATNGLSYRVDGETWAHGGVSLTTDQVHWSATVTIDRNPSTQPRVGTLRFTLASGAVQDVVVYQGGTN